MTNNSNFCDITIIHKMYNFYLAFHHISFTLPKKDRLTIGIKSANLTIEMLEQFYQANAVKGSSRLAILKSIDVKLKILRLFMKALFDVKAINDQKFLRLSEQLIEIGKMLGGWMKTTKI